MLIESKQKEPVDQADDLLQEHRQLINKIRETDGWTEHQANMQISAFEKSFAEL